MTTRTATTLLRFVLMAGLMATPLLGAEEIAPSGESSAPQVTPRDLSGVPLEDLLEMDFSAVLPSSEALMCGGYSDQSIGAASARTFDLRESPGVITVITAEEIRASGARDLVDLLQLIPGFTFGVDVWGVVGLAVRGNWAHEGKVLLLVDGQEMQELDYGTLQFGNHIPVSVIHRIEIIRGPGSSLYGGNAALAVINILTKRPQDLSGVEVSAQLGQYGSFDLSDAYHRSASLSVGKNLGELAFVLHGGWTQGSRSDRRYTDFGGDSYDMAENSRMSNLFLDAGASFGDLALRIIYDRYRLWERDQYGVNLPFSVPSSFDSILAELRYDWQIAPRMRLVPKLNAKIQFPWYTHGEDVVYLDQSPTWNGIYTGILNEERFQRYTGSLVFFYDIHPDLNLALGTRGYYDQGDALGELDLSPGEAPGGAREIDFWNVEGFLEGSWQTRFINLVAGGRVEHHSEAGNSFVPRLSLTKAFDTFHYKLLLSRAFRAPSMANILYFNPTYSQGAHILPEVSTIVEAEGGYRFSKRFFLNANLYYIHISDPIVYFYDEDDSYDNFGAASTWGGELELRYQGKKSYLYLSYAYYQSLDNTVAFYRVPRPGQETAEDPRFREDLVLGIPQHKLAVHHIVTLWRGLTLSTSAVLMSSRYGYTHADSEGNPLIGELDPQLLLNAHLSYQNLFVQGLRAGLGVYNLLDAGNDYVQPYNGGHAPLPGPSRELSLSLGYDRKF